MARVGRVSNEKKIRALEEYVLSGSMKKAADAVDVTPRAVWNWVKNADRDMLEIALKRAENILFGRMLSAIEPHIENIKNAIKVEQTTAKESAEIITRLTNIMKEFRELSVKLKELEAINKADKSTKIELVINEVKPEVEAEAIEYETEDTDNLTE